MTQTTSPAPTPSGAFWQRFRDLGSLRRPSDHRALAGVAEGLSRHFDVDPIIVRVLFAALTFFGGAGLILYVALWLTVPTDVTGQSVISGRLNRDPHAWTTAGLAIGGVLAAVALLGSISWAVPHPFPFLLIALVVVLGLLALTRRGDRVFPVPAANSPQPPDSTSPPAPRAEGSPEPSTALIPTGSTTVERPTPSPTRRQRATIVGPHGDADRDPSTRAEDSTDPTTEFQAPADTRAWWQRDDLPRTGEPIPPFAVQPPPPRRPRSHLFGLTMAVIALAEAAVWIIDATTSYDVNPSVYPGTALAIIAAALLLGTWWGRSRGLIAMGILASLITAVVAFTGPGPYGDRSAVPFRAAELQSHYTMGSGRFTLHLEQIRDIDALQGREVTVNQRIGHVVVIIPSSVAAVVDATADHGNITGPSNANDIGQGGERVLMTPAADGRPTITLHLHVVYGEVRIERAACPEARLTPAKAKASWLWMGDTYVAAACN